MHTSMSYFIVIRRSVPTDMAAPRPVVDDGSKRLDIMTGPQSLDYRIWRIRVHIHTSVRNGLDPKVGYYCVVRCRHPRSSVFFDWPANVRVFPRGRLEGNKKKKKMSDITALIRPPAVEGWLQMYLIIFWPMCFKTRVRCTGSNIVDRGSSIGFKLKCLLDYELSRIASYVCSF